MFYMPAFYRFLIDPVKLSTLHSQESTLLNIAETNLVLGVKAQILWSVLMPFSCGDLASIANKIPK